MMLPRQGYFDDREHAAERLAEALLAYRGRHPLVLAIPRGGVPIGRVLADRLDGDLDVVLVRKLGAPGQEEFAVGAVSEDGQLLVAEHAARAGADDAYLRGELARQLEVIARRRELYSAHREALDPAGRTVIVVDDGLATGATMQAAAAAARRGGPKLIIVAVPVGARQAVHALRRSVDRVICPSTPEPFIAVGIAYQDFHQLSDEETQAIIAAHRP